MLGYTEEIQDGISYPDTDPDIDTVSKLTADIIILRAELLAYMDARHPHPASLNSVLPSSVRLDFDNNIV